MISRKLIRKTEALLSRESGTVYKDPGGRVNICLIYPNRYHVGMSNLGFQGIYTILNERDDTLCERAFLPDDDDLREYERTGSELFSMESKRPLNRFDIVAFSVSFENDYLSIPTILRLASIGIFGSDRTERDPLLLLGGVCPTFNPEPLADFFDLIIIGEAETVVNELIERYISAGSRNSLLKLVSELDGFYLPGLYDLLYTNSGRIKERVPLKKLPDVVRKRREISLTGSLRASITTPETEFSDMYMLESMRGCVWNCRFCLAGHIYNPPRQKDPKTLKMEIAVAKKKGSRVGLIGPSLSDYRHIKEALQTENVAFSITSLRATPQSGEILSLMKGVRSISIAPEAGTERMRGIINKRVSEDEILQTSEQILKEGVETLRLYFMVGLPFENEEDIEGIIELVKKIRSLSGRSTVVLSVSTFVPKPFTPFQWHPMTDEKIIKARLKRIKRSLNIKGVKVFHDVIKYAYLQGLFSRGDRRLSKVINEIRDPGSWRTALRDAGLTPDFYILRQRELDEILPWDFIDAGLSKKSLWDEYLKAKESAK